MDSGHHPENDAEQQLAEFLVRKEGYLEYLQYVDAIKVSFDDLLSNSECAEEGRITFVGLEPRSLFTNFAYIEFEEKDDSPIIYGRNFTENRLLVYKSLFPESKLQVDHYTAVLSSKTYSTSGEPAGFGSNVLHIFADDTSRVFSAYEQNPGGQVNSTQDILSGKHGPYIHYDYQDIQVANNHSGYKLNPSSFYREHWRINDLDNVGRSNIVISGHVIEDLYPFCWFLDNYIGSDMLANLPQFYSDDED
jgi:hypothetical protein